MEWHKPPFKLKEIKIEVTHDCMLHCVHCSSTAEETTGRIMDWTSCKKILDDATNMGVERIAFSGGEPLLWEHIQCAVEHATHRGIDVDFYTTGNAPGAENLLDKLRGAGLSRVMFSVFGADAEQHERVTVTCGSYDKTVAMIAHCVNIGIHTEFHFVPLPHNFSALQAISDRARSMGIKKVSLLRLVPQGRSAVKKVEELSHHQNLELRRIIKEVRKHGHGIRLGSPYNFLMLQENPKCCSGIDRLTIGPDLRIFPCDAFKHISPVDIGVSSNLSCLCTNSLAECWEKSPYLGAVRKYLTADFAPECTTCRKLDDCLSGCVAQKFYAYGELKKCPDPMCLLRDGKQSSLDM
jgi:radical SAM protein with 4Fe4S-binding SPASM domain